MRKQNLLENSLTRKIKSHKNVNTHWHSHTTPGNRNQLQKKIHNKVKVMTWICQPPLSFPSTTYTTLEQQFLHDLYIPISITILWASNPETAFYSSSYSYILEQYLPSMNIYWFPTMLPSLSEASEHRIV